MAEFLGSPKVQYFKTGTVEYLSGGKVYSYDAGTSTPRATYPTIADALALTNANTNPVILDSRGEANIVVSGATKIILKDSSDNTIWTVDNLDQTSQDILDSNGNELLKFVSVASAVNEFTITNAATTNAPIFSSTGGDTNVGMKLTSKGSGTLYLDAGATGTVDIGTTSTGAINLKRTTAITGDLSISGNVAALSVTGNITTSATSAIDFIPAGTVLWKASTTVPDGWLECNGAAISRTTYSALFADIGTTWGVGNGTTTFNIPTSARRTIVGKGGSSSGTLSNTVGSTGGEETHTMTLAEMVSHEHVYLLPSATAQGFTGGNSINAGANGTTNTTSVGSSTPFNVMQPSMVMMMIIKAY